ncbi:tyrosine-type recombinase/integrase [Actinocorallia populi]|uniref:tyrosine-type recombinase/integrase n=1 Tax=Actinocorallia populi TaxID=2079200 RepID=UPI0022B7DE56|nr:tyrosine-type recombinase/integrase [Actinocorallia populi]
MTYALRLPVPDRPPHQAEHRRPAPPSRPRSPDHQAPPGPGDFRRPVRQGPATSNGRLRPCRPTQGIPGRCGSRPAHPFQPRRASQTPRRQTSEPGKAWTSAQLRTFLSIAQTHRLFAFFRLAAYFGARRSELLNLRWRDVDFDAAEIRITGSAAFIAGERIEGTTKSGRSRTVSLDEETVKILRAHCAKQNAESWNSVKPGAAARKAMCFPQPGENRSTRTRPPRWSPG